MRAISRRALATVLSAALSGCSDSSGATETNPPVLASGQLRFALDDTHPAEVTLSGRNFVRGVVALWNGERRPTYFVSSVTLILSLSAEDLAGNGIASVRVVSPAPQRDSSNAIVVSIANPVPLVLSVDRTSVGVSASWDSVRIFGQNFIPQTEIAIGPYPLFSHYVSSTEIVGRVRGLYITDPQLGEYRLNVFNPRPGGGAAASWPMGFHYAKPEIDFITPCAVRVGNQAYVVFDVTGIALDGKTRTYLNGRLLNITVAWGFGGGFQLAASDVAAPGVLSIEVENPAPGGGRSAAVRIPVYSGDTAPACSNTPAASGHVLGSRSTGYR